MNSSVNLKFPALSLRQIAMCVEVVRKGSVRAASETLGISQSAISMGIKESEKVLGSKIFHHQGRSLRLSETGRWLFPRFEELLRQVNELEENVSQDGDLACGHLTIGASSTIGCYLLPSIIAQFSEQFPKMILELKVGNTQEMLSELSHAGVDVVFVEGACEGGAFQPEAFYWDEMCVVATPNHPLFESRRISWKSLMQETWLCREDGSGSHAYFQQYCAAKNLIPHREIHVGNTEAIIRCVEQGIGIACLSTLAVQRSCDMGMLKRVRVSPVKRPFYKVRNKGQYHGRVAEMFLKAVEAFVVEMD